MQDMDQRSYFLHIVSSYSSTICWNGHSLFIELPLHLCRKSIVHVYGSVLDSVMSHWSTCLHTSTSTVNYCSFVKSWNLIALVLQLCSFFFLPKLFWLFQVLWLSTWSLESTYQFSQNSLLGFCLGLYWICISIWRELTS